MVERGGGLGVCGYDTRVDWRLAQKINGDRTDQIVSNMLLLHEGHGLCSL